MLKLTDNQIKEIAQDLDAGQKCYYNKETGEIKSLPDFDDNPYAEEEMWEEEIEKIEEEFDKYIIFEKMQSYEFFKIMEEFAEEVDDRYLKSKLFLALSKRKPFQHFKTTIDYSGPYRQMWFDFKAQKYMDWVKDQISAINFQGDDE